MFSRPAFLNRWLDKLFGLESQIVLQSTLWSGLLGALFVFGASQIDSRRGAEAEAERAAAIAQTAGLWLDGDAHSLLGDAPEVRLSDLGAQLEVLLRNSGYPGSVQTFRPTSAQRAALADKPLAAHEKALEQVITVGPAALPKVIDYRPELAPVFQEKRCVRFERGGQVEAYAPVLDSWGSTAAVVVVRAPAHGPLWRRLLFLAAAGLCAGLLIAASVGLSRRYARGLAARLGSLGADVEELARGPLGRSLELDSGPRELRRLAAALETLRGRMGSPAHGGASGSPHLPEPAGFSTVGAPSASLGEAVEFDLALLVQQLIEPARKAAHARRVDLQLVFPDGVPSRLTGHPVALYQALDALVKNALRTTQQGNITLRVTRVGDPGDACMLRFEVADTSPGIPFAKQDALRARLAEPVEGDPSKLRDPLQQAGALIGSLGGELGFQSQPGQGSRFGFTAAFQGGVPRPSTGFQPLSSSAFQPRAGVPR